MRFRQARCTQAREHERELELEHERELQDIARMKAEEEAARLMSEMDLARRRAAEVTHHLQHTTPRPPCSFGINSPALGLEQLYWCALLRYL